MNKVSAIITTLNEADNIREAIQSVRWVDEVIVVDSFSEDGTFELAQKLADKTLQRTYTGPADQKNWAIPQADNEWVLVLDADERVPAELAAEIKQLLQQEKIPFDCFWIGRNNHFMGKSVRYSGWQGDQVIRLIRRDRCRYNRKQVHEEIETEGLRVGRLHHKLTHFTFKNLSHYLEKTERYGRWSAQDHLPRTPKITIFHFLFKPFWRFVKHYIFQAGFRDGKTGLIVSAIMAWGVFLRYAFMEEQLTVNQSKTAFNKKQTMKKRTIPVVDLSKFTHGTPEERAAFVDELGKAFHEIGFVGVINHGVPDELIDKFYTESKNFFALPEAVKRQYEIAGLAGQRGYTSFGKEHAKQSKVADLKEFFQIGQEVPPNHPLKPEYPDNVSVAEAPEFAKTGIQLYKAFEKAGGQLLKAIAIHLDIGEDYFEEEIRYGNSILRSIFYPPITQEPASAIRAEQHEDINLITLLVGASAGGLQLLNKHNEWMDITPEENEIVINVGDMLQRLTNNYLKSTTHRVVNPPRESWHLPRLSIPFFLHPVSKMDLSCLEGCVTADQPLAYEPITAGGYLDERLREIGLKK